LGDRRARAGIIVAESMHWRWHGRCSTAGMLNYIRTLGIAMLVLLAMGSAQAGTKRCPQDADCDGLSNRDERVLGTNRWRADSDGDGLTDEFEARRLGTSPMVADTDGDGAGDGDEVCDGTDPQQGDDDGAHGDGKHGRDDREPRIAGPVDAVDPTAMTITLFGCLAIDVSTAEVEGVEALADIAAGTFVKAKLDGTKLPMLVATEVEVEADMSTDPGDDCPDDGQGGDEGEGSGDGSGDETETD
jgi:hypothetical protein